MQNLLSQLGKGADSQAGEIRDETPNFCAFILAIQYRKRDVIKISSFYYDSFSFEIIS